MNQNPFQENQSQNQPYAPQASHTFDINTAPPRQFPWGCLLGGCLGVVLLGFLAIGLLTWGAYSFAQNQLAKFTADAPIELPSVDIEQDEVDAIKNKLEVFRQQFESGNEAQELVITEREINALIAGDSDLKGRVYFRIEDGNLRADVSFPLDKFPLVKGRYFNGSVLLHVRLENGVLVANVIDAEANGESIPEEFMEEFRNQNLAKDIYKDVKTAEALQRCESLIVEEDRIVLKLRNRTQPQPPASESGNNESGNSGSGSEATTDPEDPKSNF